MTAGADPTPKLWDLTTRQVVATLKGHTEGLASAIFSADGRILATGSGDGTIKLWYGAP